MKVKVREDVLAQSLDGESILLNLESEQYFGLDDVGTTIWETLRETGSLEKTHARLFTLYEVDAETLHEDLTSFVEELARHGLIEIVKA